MATVIDCLGIVTPAAATAMKAAGVVGCVLYVDRTLPHSKNAVLGAGLELASNYETSGHSGQGGAAYGATEARTVVRLHEASGGPKGVVLWLSPFDFDMRDTVTAQAYIDAANAVLKSSGYLAGYYGAAGLGAATRGWDAWWQSESTAFWNNAQAWSLASLVQRVPMAHTYAGVETDGNILQHPDRWGSWTAPAPAPAPPAGGPGPNDVLIGTEWYPMSIFQSDADARQAAALTWWAQYLSRAPDAANLARWANEIQAKGYAGALNEFLAEPEVKSRLAKRPW